MQFSKRLIIVAAIASIIAGLTGCASDMIEVRKGSDSVALAGANQIENCQAKGEIKVSVLANIGIFSRSAEAVEANLLQMARNGAIDSGGDTVVKGISPEFGKRTFAIYKCQP